MPFDEFYNTYLEERKALIEAEAEGARLFDRAILTLAAGAFGISLAFIDRTVSGIENGIIVWLFVAWGGFVTSMLTTLVSFLTSQKAYRRQRELLDQYYEQYWAPVKSGACEYNESGRPEVNESNKWRTLTSWLNIISILTFILGSVALATFGIMSLIPNGQEAVH